MAGIVLKYGMISIHVPNAGNDSSTGAYTRWTSISIHVPNAGNDVYQRHDNCECIVISIHVPNAGNDSSTGAYTRWTSISIHVPNAGNDESDSIDANIGEGISIHVPNAGNDLSSYPPDLVEEFQSTFPMQGTTATEEQKARIEQIFQSTFPMQGTTDPNSTKITKIKNFNPRSQCRERQQTYPNINLKQHYICNILRFSFNIFSSLIYIVIQYSIFVQLFWCESPGIFMYTSYSHYQIAV